MLALSGISGGLPVQEFSLTASAAESGTLGDNLTWTLDDDGVMTISGSGEWDDHAFLADRTFKAAVIEDGVTSIKDTGFGACSEMVSVSISNSVAEIGYGAFFNCSSLRSVTLPDSITCIENTTFSFCTNLAEITIPDSVASIDKEAFSNSGLTEITFPDSVAVIGEEALAYCQSLNSVTFLNPNCEIYDNGLTICNSATATKPRTIVYAGVIRGYAGSTAQAYAEKYGYTFEAIGEAPTIVTSGTCGENLTWTLDDEGTLTISGAGAMTDFDYVDKYQPWMDIKSNIKKIVIEDGVTSIGNDAFSGCAELTEITIPDSVTDIGEYAFRSCGSLVSVRIPDNVTSIEESAFEGCTSLTSITIPGTVTSIGIGAFSRCSSLTDIVIPDSVVNIGINAFAECGKLKNIIIPESVTLIATNMFFRCESLTSITIPESVTNIDGWAFLGCTNLTDIIILNPSCVIYDYSGTIPETTIIHGYAGSTAQVFAEKYGRTFESLGEAPSVEPFPDMDGNNEITASDAQTVLIAFADILAGNEPNLTPEQLAAADVDGNSEITALDAQYILTYYLYNTVLEQPMTWDEILHPNGE